MKKDWNLLTKGKRQPGTTGPTIQTRLMFALAAEVPYSFNPANAPAHQFEIIKIYYEC